MKVLVCCGLVLAIAQWTGVVACADDVAELRERAVAMRREAAELLAKGHDEESNKLTKESMILLEKARHVASQNEKEEGHQHSEAAVLRERLEDLKVALVKAREASASEQEVHSLEEQLQQTKKHLMEVSKGPKAGATEDQERQERNKKLELAMRRVRHLHMAAENLKAAEMHDMAHEIMQKAEAIERDVHAAREEERARHRQHSEGEVADEMRELRQENERLRNALKELQEQK